MVNQILELLVGDHHNKAIYLRMNMIGKRKLQLKRLKNYNFVFFSVTIERQANEIRLRIRNLTTEDQGICHNFFI